MNIYNISIKIIKTYSLNYDELAHLIISGVIGKINGHYDYTKNSKFLLF